MHQTGGYYLHTRWLNQYNSLPWIIHDKHEICTINLRVNIEHCLNLGLNRNRNNIAHQATPCVLRACIWRSPPQMVSHLQYMDYSIQLMSKSLGFNLRLILGYFTLSLNLRTSSEDSWLCHPFDACSTKHCLIISVINLSPTCFVFFKNYGLLVAPTRVLQVKCPGGNLNL